MTAHELFTTETTGTGGRVQPTTIRLHDGDYFDLRIAPVRKNIDGDDLRMLAYNGSIPGPNLHVDQGSEVTVRVSNDGDVDATVHWHGLRLENRYDGVPHETQEPIPLAARSRTSCSSPTPGFTGTTRTFARTSRRKWGCTARSSSNPAIRVLASSRPVPDAHAGRLARRGRSCRAVPQVRSEFQCDGPVRQCHADQRRGDVFWRGSCWRGRTALSREHR